MSSYALFLDDIRIPLTTRHVYMPPYNWEIAKTYNEFVRLITEKGLPYFISFDHDLSHEHYPFNEPDGGRSNPNVIPYDTYKEKTGYHCALWLIDYCAKNKLKLPQFQVHSMNPIGKKNIENVLTHMVLPVYPTDSN
jgi:hypothetical protein